MFRIKQKAALFGAICLMIFACSPVQNQSSGLRGKRVIVIGVDAMSPDGINNASTPVMDMMMREGAYTLNGRGVLPTSSSTNWKSMVSGTGPEHHGVTSNNWEKDDFTLPPVNTGTEDFQPTIFGIARQQRPELKIGAAYNWRGFGRLIERSALDYDIYEATGKEEIDENETTQLAVDYIKNEKPDFLFVHLDHVDHAGHHDGHKTAEFYEAVSKADKLIGQIVQATKDAGVFDETIFIVSADHGGIGYGHGGETLDEIEIPFILYGNGIKKNYLIKHQVMTYDNAATVAYILGVKPPYTWIGRPVKSAFVGEPEPDMGDKKPLIASPVIYPKPELFDPAGGLYVDKDATVKIESKVKGAEIRYTLNGSTPTSQSNLYSKEFKLDKSAVVLAKAFYTGTDGSQESNATKAYFRVVKSGGKNGVNYSYYEGSGWSFIPVISSLKAKKSGKKFEFRIDDINDRGDQFVIRFVSYIQIDKDGSYKFYTNSDDGSKLYINDELVVDNDGDHGTIERAGSIDLKKGLHKITVDYLNAGGGAWLDAFYKGPGIPKQIIPADKLFLKASK
ncbi:alkaline phosphatase family protein [Reichenbachiella sp. MALMAid0571]|uniref:alkaline phosphatase family protein n=1 Tax=Reichenbachiella sp. MALMAid0571 TaxID=3143939 RepID=UPI0032DFFD34